MTSRSKRSLFEEPPAALLALPQVISLGAGVQSSTMALMAAHGKIGPMPTLAIFADTGWEPPEVYTWLDWLEEQLPFPVVRVGNGQLREHAIGARVRGKRGEGHRWMSIPVFTVGPDGTRGQMRRQCTNEYKIAPIERHLKRDVLGLVPGARLPATPRLLQWRGISYDEMQRAKYSRETWFDVRYPLMERGMTRGHCLEWMRDHGYPEPPRSACIGCPYHSNEEWQRIKQDPVQWADAVEFDEAIRVAGGMRGETYIHSSLVPLKDANLATAESEGQIDWLDECEGMCGV